MKSKLTLLFLILYFAMSAQSKYTQAEFDSFQDKIYPIVKVLFDSIPNQPTDFTFSEGNSPIKIMIESDLYLFFGIDRGKNYELICESDLPGSISVDELKKLSIINLENLVGDDIKLNGTNFGGHMLLCGYNLEASLILLDWIWGDIEASLGYELAIGVPSKDLVLIVDKNDVDQINKLKELIAEIHLDGEYLLSKKIFEYNGQTIKEIDE